MLGKVLFATEFFLTCMGKDIEMETKKLDGKNSYNKAKKI